MPILDIEIVGPSPDPNPGQNAGNTPLAQRLADAAGLALNSRPEGTWVKLRYLDPNAYAENQGCGDVRPVFINLTLANPPSGDALSAMLNQLTKALAEVLNITPSNLHILLQPAARGRISFGGQLVT